jgi:hypothetical protein
MECISVEGKREIKNKTMRIPVLKESLLFYIFREKCIPDPTKQKSMALF